MNIKQIKNMYQITVLPSILPVNCFIYEEEKELTLIDAGLPMSEKPILNAINQIGKPLTKIVLTHAHDDHIGALDSIKTLYPEAKLYISERDSRLLKGDTTLDQTEPPFKIKGGVPKNLKSIPDLLVKEGDEIGSLTVIETKGHTPGSISLYCSKNKLMIVGDLMQTVTNLTLASEFKWRFPFPHLATWNKEFILQSAKKIMNYDIEYLFVGHGKYVQNPKEKIRKEIEKNEKKH